eukprot:TRINITY_DN8769_c0_g1_i2.p1 TRINITY_DN8769_c0_g1~~TRINITY_DN8769_c0_g1_i2.p1  ORF type:complete len:283 (+),score=60.53 TRINITY_DN8769_c0_g1_i2:90-938(+)
MCSRPTPVSPTEFGHPNITHLKSLLGAWEGQGQGVYPNITPFKYHEKSTFTSLGPAKPIIHYVQKTFAVQEGKPVLSKPMHTECGYIRVLSPPTASPQEVKLELCLADPTGIAQIFSGKIDFASETELQITWQSLHVSCSPSAKKVTTVSRSWKINTSEKTLNYTLDMGALGNEHQNHLTASLVKDTNGALTTIPEDAIIIDVREATEFAEGHIEGAINIPIGEALRDCNKPSFDKIREASNVFLYCQSGGRSNIVADTLRANNFSSVNVLQGGYAAYLAQK